jgi:hypothetical protein
VETNTGSIDKLARAHSVTALRLGKSHFAIYETHLSAIQADAETTARLSCADAHQRRSGDSCAPASTRPQTAAPERRREALRPPHAGLIFEIRHSNFIPAPLAQLAEQVTLNHDRSEVELSGLPNTLPVLSDRSRDLLRRCGGDQIIPHVGGLGPKTTRTS